MKFGVVSDESDFLGLGSLWHDLIENSSSNSLFLTHEYLTTWWSVYGGAYKLRIVTAHDYDGNLVGIAPMMIGPGTGLKRRLFRHLAFIGGLDDTLAEFQDFIVARGCEAEVVAGFADIFFDTFRAEWDVLQLGLVPLQSHGISVLRELVRERTGQDHLVDQHSAPFASLPDNWESFLATRSKKFRTGLKQRENRIKNKHRVEYLTAGREISISEAIGIVSALSHDRWGERNLAFTSDKYATFHTRLAELLVPQNRVYLVVMKLDGDVVAARYDIIHAGKIWGFQGGWKRSHAHLALGRIMLSRELQWAIDCQLHEYDFLAGDASYKLEWSTGTRALADLEAHNPKTLRGRLFQVARWAKPKTKGAGNGAAGWLAEPGHSATLADTTD